MGEKERCHVEHYVCKKSVKGEDFAMGEASLKWEWPGEEEKVQEFGLFAVFDGHGGPEAANLCKSNVTEVFLEQLDFAHADLSAKSEGKAIDWEQDLLPAALTGAFSRLNEMCCETFQTSGTTASVVVVSITPHLVAQKWCFITVANVGDSHVYVEYGSKPVVKQLNEDHRLDNNTAERERVIKEGGEVDRAGKDKEDKSDPLRMWPGGLMMSRTLGDPEAKQSIPVAAISKLMLRLVDEDESTPLPAKIIVASDGLWDVLTGKQSFGLARRKNPQAGAQLLGSTAVKKAGQHRDDISIIVIDVARTKQDISESKRDRAHSTASSILSSASAILEENNLPSDIKPNTSNFFWHPLKDQAPLDQVAQYEQALELVRMATKAEAEKMEQERREMEEAVRASLLQQQLEEEANLRNGSSSSQNGYGTEEPDMDNAGDVAWEEVSKRQNHKENEVSANTKTKKKKAKKEKSSLAKRVCFTFKNTGSCERGDSCKFSHEIPPNEIPEHSSTTQNDPPTDGQPNWQSMAARIAAATNSGPILRTKGVADARSQSAKVHNEKVTRESEVVGRQERPPKREKVCFAFQRGKCARGDTCQFAHVPAASNNSTKEGAKGPEKVKKADTKHKAGNSEPVDNNDSKQPRAAQPKQKQKKQAGNYDLFISGLNENVKKDELQKYFENFGEVSVFNVKFENKSRGYAFVSYKDPNTHLSVLAQPVHLLEEVLLDVKKFVLRQRPEKENTKAGAAATVGNE